MKNILVLIMLSSLFSCSSYIELEPEEYTPKIVVDGWIESGDYGYVFLTFSSPFITSYDSASINASIIKGGKITLTSSKGESEILTLFHQNNFFPPFVYRSVNIKGESGCTYGLKVEAMGKVLTASTSIPAAPEVTGLQMETATDSSGFIRIDLSPSGMEYIFLLMKSTFGKDKNYHPAKIPILLSQASANPRKLYLLRRNETNMALLNPETYPYENWPDYQFSIKDTVRIKVGKVDEESYRVLMSVFTDQPSQYNPFALNSAGIKSNIVGGIGRWTGIGLAPVQIYYGK